MAELPLHLKQLETLPSALDILRYLYDHPDHVADVDQICTALDISDRRFLKANRRLVTLGYLAMQSDSAYELTPKGLTAGEELRQYDANAPLEPVDTGKLSRRGVLVMPRMLVAGQPSTITFGLSPLADPRFGLQTLILRLSAINAELSVNGDTQVQAGSGPVVQALQIIPEFYDQVRVKLQVFQLSDDGEDISDCGGLYVDVDVSASGAPGGLVAYGAPLTFTPA